MKLIKRACKVHGSDETVYTEAYVEDDYVLGENEYDAGSEPTEEEVPEGEEGTEQE